jgi:hypothetical protein
LKDFIMSNADLGNTPIVLFTAKELYEAQAVHDALEEAGIPSRIEGEYLTSVVGDVPFGESNPRVMVRQEDEAAARTILDRIRAELQQTRAAAPDDGRCLSCGADMRNSDTCPNCGWSFRDAGK